MFGGGGVRRSDKLTSRGAPADAARTAAAAAFFAAVSISTLAESLGAGAASPATWGMMDATRSAVAAAARGGATRRDGADGFDARRRPASSFEDGAANASSAERIGHCVRGACRGSQRHQKMARVRGEPWFGKRRLVRPWKRYQRRRTWASEKDAVASGVCATMHSPKTSAAMRPWNDDLLIILNTHKRKSTCPYATRAR